MNKIIAIGIGILLFISCKSGISGKGDIKEKEIKLDFPIEKLDLKGNYFAVLIQSEDQKIVIEAEENLIDNIVVDISETSVSISEKQNAHTEEIYKIYIFSKALEKLEIGDNVEFDVSGELRKNEFKVELKDNSKWLSQVLIDELTLESKDNSSISIKGTCTNFDATLEDNSKLISPDFIISTADIDLSDNAQMNVQIISELEGESSDNSVLEYRGNPNKDFQEKDQSKLLKIE